MKNMEKEIVCICGSKKFNDLINAIAFELSKAGKIVFHPNFLPDWYIRKSLMLSDRIDKDNELSSILSDIHFNKIKYADKIFICNQNGYIGKDTQKEIEYAKSLNKPILYLWCQNNEFTEITDKVSR